MQSALGAASGFRKRRNWPAAGGDFSPGRRAFGCLNAAGSSDDEFPRLAAGDQPICSNRPKPAGPGKPADDVCIKAFNGRLREEFPSANRFPSLDAAGTRCEDRRKDQNESRPHTSCFRLPGNFEDLLRKKMPKAHIAGEPAF